MPKTVYSKRNPLTPEENPTYKYERVFTEAQAKGACRTKFWLVNSKDRKMFIEWMKKWCPNYVATNGASGVAFVIK